MATDNNINRRENKIPIILYGQEYWDKVINFEYLADLGLISGE